MKGVLAGVPVSCVCMSAFKNCIKGISREKVPSIACRVVAYVCTPSLFGLGLVGSISDLTILRKIKGSAKLAVNRAAIPVTGPSVALDKTLAIAKTAIFGEPVPLGFSLNLLSDE